MSVVKMINEVVEKVNKNKKHDLLVKNKEYLDSFIENNREEKYQSYLSNQKKWGL